MKQHDSNYPQFIKVDKEVREKYLLPLKEDERSPFYKKELGEIFLLSAVYGLKYDRKYESSDLSDLRTYFQANDKYKLVIRLIVLEATNYEYDVLMDGIKTLQIFQQYANGGAKILYEQALEHPLDNPYFDNVWEQVRNEVIE